MIDVWLRAAIRWCLRMFVLLAFVSAGRIGYVAYARPAPMVVYRELRELETEAPQHSPPVPFGLEALQTRLAPSIPSDLLRDHVSGVAGTGNRPPPRTRVYLVVNVGPDRSELLINGVTQGHTPYVGEMGCQAGTVLRITVVPRSGMPKHFERDCDRHEIRIDE